MAYTTVLISLDIVREDGTAFTGTLSVRLNNFATDATEALIVPYDLSAFVVNGTGTINLVPNSQLSDDSFYVCTLLNEGGTTAGRFRIVVPDHNCKISDIAKFDLDNFDFSLSHADLKDRDKAKQHPIGSITGLQSTIASISTEYELVRQYKDDANASKAESIKQANKAAEYAAYIEKLLEKYKGLSESLSVLLEKCQALRDSVDEALVIVQEASEKAASSAAQAEQAASQAAESAKALADAEAQLAAIRDLVEEARSTFAAITEAAEAAEAASQLAQSASEHAVVAEANAAEYANAAESAAESANTAAENAAYALDLAKQAAEKSEQCADKACTCAEAACEFADAAEAAKEGLEQAHAEALDAATRAAASAAEAADTAAYVKDSVDQAESAATRAENAGERADNAANRAEPAADRAEAYAEQLKSLVNTSITRTAAKSLPDALAENSEVELPIEYVVGSGALELYYDGEFLAPPDCGVANLYTEVGEKGTLSTKVTLLFAADAGSQLIEVVRAVTTLASDAAKLEELLTKAGDVQGA